MVAIATGIDNGKFKKHR